MTDEKRLCPYLVTTVHNTRNINTSVELKSTTQKFQQCVGEKCMAYDKEKKDCRKL
jgi:hypothetical protein